METGAQAPGCSTEAETEKYFRSSVKHENGDGRILTF